MSNNFFNELEIRRSGVEKIDLEMRNRNLDHYRSFWLQMMIFSSAVVVGVLPLISESESIIRSPILAKLGLLVIIILCTFIILYFQGVLIREKVLLFEQSEFHKNIFSKQHRILEQSRDKTDEVIKKLFETSKNEAFVKEQDILAKHLIGGKFYRIRLFIDKYFTRFVSFGFTAGILLIIFSFIFSI